MYICHDSVFNCRDTMKKVIASPVHDEILIALKKFPNGAGIDEIRLEYNPEINLRTLQRRLGNLSKQGHVVISGNARSTIYKLTLDDTVAEVAQEQEILIPLSRSSLAIRKLVTGSIQARQPVGYSRDFLESYRPNIDSYLTKKEIAKLAELGDTKTDQPAGTYAQQILNRLLIDLSWNSSRLEGNTYSLLDTERLISQGEADDTKSAKDAQMILNHKDAIEFIVQAAEEIGYNRYTLLNLHAMLANNLLPDPQAPGRLRSIPVGISRSAYTPLGIPQLIEELFDILLEKARQIENPFEQSFFMMVHLPYLQPFDDVNKRVSRLAANISLIRGNLSPLSFIDVPNDLYTQGMLAVYELNEIDLLKDVFLWAYERSATRYSVIRQSLGDPNPLKLKYRNQIRDLINKIIIEGINSKDASKLIMKVSAELPNEDKAQFVEAVETEIMALHEGNFARYRVSPKEFIAWKSAW